MPANLASGDKMETEKEMARDGFAWLRAVRQSRRIHRR
jgi:hypothetical protein